METHEHAGLADRRRLLRRDRGAHVLGPETTPRHRRRLLLGEPPPRLVRRGRVDLRVQHRLRASRGPGRGRGDERRRAGALRAARLVPPRARVGDGTVLRPHHGVHHAGVPRAALLPRGPLGALAHLARGLRADQARRRHLRGRGRVRRAVLRPDHRAVVLDHRPVHRATRAGGAGRARGAAGIDLRRVLEAPPRVHFHHPGHDRPRPGEDGTGAGPRDDGGRRRPRDPQRSAGRLPPHGHHCHARGDPRDGGLRPAVPDRLVSMDRQQHLFSVLQPVHFRRLMSHDDRRELCDGGARGGAGHQPDVRHGDGRKPRTVAGELEPLGRDQLGHRARAYPARLSVLHRLRRGTMTLSRRNAIKLGLGAGAGALPLLGYSPLLVEAEARAPRARASDVVKAWPLPLSAVRLQAGPLKHAQELDARYLLALEPDRMLAYYRDRAGLPPKAEPYGGWDGDGRNLTGHIAGHHLSAVSLMWAATGDARFKQRADYIVGELKQVQDAHGDGYLSALKGGRRAFGELARGEIRSAAFDLNGEWYLWYILHKT